MWNRENVANLLNSVIFGLALVGCSNGNTSTTNAIYLPAGTYNMTFNNLRNNGNVNVCEVMEPYSLISDGKGTICHTNDENECAYGLNLTNNPCLSMSTDYEQMTSTNETWEICKLTNTGMETQIVFSIKDTNNTTSNCTANMILTKD